MKYIWGIITTIFMAVLGMQGGQGKIGGKTTRRVGLPFVASAYAGLAGLGWKALVFLLWIPLLSMGYGVDSHIGALCFHIEWLIRLVYAILLSLPFLVFSLARWIICAILLVIAFQMEAGSLGYTSWFGDFLIEDICRFFTLGVLLVVNCLTYRKNN